MPKNLDPNRLNTMIDRAIAHPQHAPALQAAAIKTTRPWGMAIAASIIIMVLATGTVMIPQNQQDYDTTIAWSESDLADDLFLEILDETI